MGEEQGTATEEEADHEQLTQPPENPPRSARRQPSRCPGRDRSWLNPAASSLRPGTTRLLRRHRGLGHRRQQCGIGRRRGKVGDDPRRDGGDHLGRNDHGTRTQPARQRGDGHDPDSPHHTRLAELVSVCTGQAEHRGDRTVGLGGHVGAHAMDLLQLGSQAHAFGTTIAVAVLEQTALVLGHAPGAVLGVDEVDAGRADRDVVEVRLGTSRPQQPVVDHGPPLGERGERRGDSSFAFSASGPLARLVHQPLGLLVGALARISHAGDRARTPGVVGALCTKFARRSHPRPQPPPRPPRPPRRSDFLVEVSGSPGAGPVDGPTIPATGWARRWGKHSGDRWTRGDHPRAAADALFLRRRASRGRTRRTARLRPRAGLPVVPRRRPGGTSASSPASLDDPVARTAGPGLPRRLRCLRLIRLFIQLSIRPLPRLQPRPQPRVGLASLPSPAPRHRRRPRRRYGAPAPFPL